MKYANVQAAHLRCNVSASNRFDVPKQLRLVG